jgi:hypothetical protein
MRVTHGRKHRPSAEGTLSSPPAQCSTSEPVSLNLTQTLDLEELLTKGWSLTGTTSIPTFKCEGKGIETNLLAGALSAVLSGPENPFSLAITAPASK